MQFTLRKKTQKEFEEELSLRHFGAAIAKGVVDKNICPLIVTMANGREVEVWSLTEQEIVKLIDATMNEMTDKGFKDPKRAAWSTQILQCWRDAHKSVSTDFIDVCFQIEKKYPKYKSVVKDMTAPFIHDQVEKAQIIADYLNGMQGDKKKITNDNIIKILRNMDCIQQQRNEQKLNK